MDINFQFMQVNLQIQLEEIIYLSYLKITNNTMRIATFRMLAKMKELGVELQPDRLYYLYDVLDFLREEHNIVVTVYQSNLPLTDPPTTTWEWGYAITKIDQPNNVLQTKWYFNTYYDALKHGIEQALSYI